jgi:hypothetical protein
MRQGCLPGHGPLNQAFESTIVEKYYPLRSGSGTRWTVSKAGIRMEARVKWIAEKNPWRIPDQAYPAGGIAIGMDRDKGRICSFFHYPAGVFAKKPCADIHRAVIRLPLDIDPPVYFVSQV